MFIIPPDMTTVPYRYIKHFGVFFPCYHEIVRTTCEQYFFDTLKS